MEMDWMSALAFTMSGFSIGVSATVIAFIYSSRNLQEAGRDGES